MPNRKLRKTVKNKPAIDVRQMALKILASNENTVGAPMLFFQNDFIILLLLNGILAGTLCIYFDEKMYFSFFQVKFEFTGSLKK
jgi:hypothetical protein